MSKKKSKQKKRRKERKAIRAEITGSTIHQAKADGLKTKEEKGGLQIDENML